MKYTACILLAIVAAVYADGDPCMAYTDCSGFMAGEAVMCVQGKCRANVPCNKDDDCGFYGMADMEYSIMEKAPVMAMCMKVANPQKEGYGVCYIKPAIMVDDDAMWQDRIPGDNVKRALRRQ